MDYGGGDQ